MEIKRTVLPPYGGPREESGANGSLWSMGGKIIGSPAAEPEPVVAYGPSQNWATENMGSGSSFLFFSSSYPDQDPEWAAIVANPTAYKLVITGGPIAGTYPIGFAGAFGPTAPGVTLMGLYQSNNTSTGFDITSNLIGLETSEMSYWVNAGRTPVAGTASIVLA